MYTRATRNFGIWRENHPTRLRYSGRPTANFVFSLAVAAFVAWMIFVILFRMRSEFFLVESLMFPLHEASVLEDDLLPSRAAAMSVAVVGEPGSDSDLRLIFDDKNSFLLNKDQREIREYVNSRMDSIEYQVMLTMSMSPATTRVQIWPEYGVDSTALQKALSLFSNLGFDDFDIAVRPGKRAHE